VAITPIHTIFLIDGHGRFFVKVKPKDAGTAIVKLNIELFFLLWTDRIYDQ